MVKDIVIGGIAGIFTGIVMFIGLGGGDKAPEPGAGSPSGVSIEELCEDQRTFFKLITTENGPQFQGVHDTPAVRYDLTWQPDGTVAAVEQLKGADFVASTQQITPAFLACVERKGYQVVPRGY